MAALSTGEVSWAFYAADYFTPTLQQMNVGVVEYTNNLEKNKAKSKETNTEWMTQMMAVMHIYSGMRRLAGSLHDLGLVSDGAMKSFNKLASVLGVAIGMFQMLRGAVKIVQMLRSEEAARAITLTYIAIMENPAKMALAAAALGAGIGAGAALVVAGSHRAKATEQTVNFNPYATPDTREVARGTLETLGAF